MQAYVVQCTFKRQHQKDRNSKKSDYTRWQNPITMAMSHKKIYYVKRFKRKANV